ncbi:flagellin hook IN motif-containing protein [Nocardioides sp. TF02-7]|uniref:flagellin hook IN motif-containing protein n=1 Tax=Nocardioides sp. TF02-7 TaxID=2917724 RepID=UPI0023DCC726|nr:flagellin hook IN motif-containing protein [Nocardioides sp. TF02-7]
MELDRLDGSEPLTLDVGSGTLAEVVAAINDTANETGLRAATVQVAPGSYRLLVESTSTGAGEDFALGLPGGTPLLGGPASVQPARDAEIGIGGSRSGRPPTRSPTWSPA